MLFTEVHTPFTDPEVKPEREPVLHPRITAQFPTAAFESAPSKSLVRFSWEPAGMMMPTFLREGNAPRYSLTVTRRIIQHEDFAPLYLDVAVHVELVQDRFFGARFHEAGYYQVLTGFCSFAENELLYLQENPGISQYGSSLFEPNGLRFVQALDGGTSPKRCFGSGLVQKVYYPGISEG